MDKRVANPFKYITYLIACLGLPANIALFRTYQQKDLEFRFNILMLLIALFDLAYLVTEIVSLSLEYHDQFDNEFNNYRGTLGFFYFFTFGGSAYTTALTATERFMAMCHGKDTDQIPIGWTILSIIGLVSLINIHNFIHFEAKGAKVVGLVLWFEANITKQMVVSINIAVNSILPTIPMIACNIFLYKQLKALMASDDFFKSNVDLQNSVFRAKITVLIGWIFFFSQMLTWIFLILHMVRFPFKFEVI